MDILLSILAFFNAIKLWTMLLLILADTILGVFIAVKTKTYDWQKLADFLATSVLPYLGGYLVVSILAITNPEFQVLSTGAAATIIATFTASVIDKFKTLTFPAPTTPKV